MNDWLMNLTNFLCVNDWLMVFMNYWLMVLMNNVLMVFMNHILMMFVEDVFVVFFYNRLICFRINYGCRDMLLHEGFSSVSCNSGCLLMSNNCGTLFIAFLNKRLIHCFGGWHLAYQQIVMLLAKVSTRACIAAMNISCPIETNMVIAKLRRCTILTGFDFEVISESQIWILHCQASNRLVS